jgi:hypothetical protein
MSKSDWLCCTHGGCLNCAPQKGPMKIIIPFIRQDIARIETLALLEFKIPTDEALKNFRAAGPLEVSVLNTFKRILSKWLKENYLDTKDFNIGDYSLCESTFIRDCRHELRKQGISSCKLIFCENIETDYQQFDEPIILKE